MTDHSRQAAGRIRPEADKHVLRIDFRFGSFSDSHGGQKTANCCRSHPQSYHPVATTCHGGSLPLGSCFKKVRQSFVYGHPAKTSCVKTALRGKIPLATTFSKVVVGSATKNVSTSPRWARVQQT